MKNIKFWLCVLLSIGITIIGTAQTSIRETIKKDFEQRKTVLEKHFPEHLKTLDTIHNQELQSYMEFLLAYSPLSDLADLNAKYFYCQVKWSQEIRSNFHWGTKIPEELFYHFVLPFRINNENPDTARIVFYKQIKDRVKGKTMYEAALEVNHWCHEKVTYRGTDERTSAPLATMKTAYGRCGEESTFTVAALRSVGIPARQVYTPRWAHSDDNHAWVEVWIDGEWYFLGACEPAPRLNMGWFAFPATRAIMMHTNVFGKYQGKEAHLFQTDYITKINCLKTYADTRIIWVKAVDELGHPIKDAEIRFNVYNYAEFYPFATFKTDKNGLCSLETGYGDLLIEMNYVSEYGFKKLPAWYTDTFSITYSDVPSDFIEKFSPPQGREIEKSNEKEAQENQSKLHFEDSLRENYISTFPDSIQCKQFMLKHQISDPRTWTIIHKSRGNYIEIMDLLEKAGQHSQQTLDILSIISEKDLRDTPETVISNHLSGIKNYNSTENLDPIFLNLYINNPRISNELLTPWRTKIQDHFKKKEIKKFRQNPQEVMNWIFKNIEFDKQGNYSRTPISPVGVMRSRIADPASANILFVAICRSIGIASRLNPINAIPQYWQQGQWLNAINEEGGKAILPQGKLIVSNANSQILPAYMTHFSLAKIENGKYITLNYEYDTIFNHFPAELKLDTGKYRLLTGNRLNDGSVITRWKEFSLAENQTISISIELASDSSQNKVLGNINRDVELYGRQNEKIKLGTMIKPEGAIIVLLNPGTEPGKHILAEMNEMKQSINEWKGRIILSMAKGISSNQPIIATDAYARISIVEDRDGSLEEKLTDILPKDKERQYPYVAYFDSKGQCYFISSAYQINTISRIFQVIYCTKTCSHE